MHENMLIVAQIIGASYPLNKKTPGSQIYIINMKESDSVEYFNWELNVINQIRIIWEQYISVVWRNFAHVKSGDDKRQK